MISGVIFDLDGVIVSTDKLHCRAWVETCSRWEIPFLPKYNDLLRGVGRLECVEIILRVTSKTLSVQEKASLADEKNKHYISLLSHISPKDILPGVMDVLKRLKELRIKTAIGSSSKNARSILEQIKLLKHFDIIVEGSMIENTKPDPEIFLMAAQLLELPANKCAVIEDSESGILAANKAGCLSIAIGSAKDCGLADHNIERIEEVIGIPNILI